MKKLAIFGLTLLLFVVGIAWLLIGNAGSIIKEVIESTGPDYLGADVSVGKIELSLTEGLCVISDVEIGNPEGFEGDYAIRLDKISVLLDTGSLGSDVIIINEVSIAGASLHTIVKGTSDTNFQKLADNVDAALGPQAPTSDTEEFKMIINKLGFVDADVSVSSTLFGDNALTIPDIHLTDVGRKSNGVTAGEVAKQLLAPISKSVLSALVKAKLKIGNIDEQVDVVKKGFKNKLLKGLGKLGKSE